MLDANGYKYTIKTRIKSVYSCWKKMERKGVKFDEIYDLYAMRIILSGIPKEEEKSECFKVYSLITSEFKPDPTRFRDWITTPKTNGYESLQTTVMTPIGQWVEIQIRTERMDMIAEKGMAAHFLYKEAHPEENISNSPVEVWLQQIRSTLENTEKSALDLVEEFKETLYTKEIYLFTPKGEMIKLPAHSTVLDFAFAIHTNLGVHCMGAKVNGKVEPIRLQTACRRAGADTYQPQNPPHRRVAQLWPTPLAPKRPSKTICATSAKAIAKRARCNAWRKSCKTRTCKLPPPIWDR